MKDIKNYYGIRNNNMVITYDSCNVKVITRVIEYIYHLKIRSVHMNQQSKMIGAVANFKQLDKAVKYKDKLACVFVLFGNINNLKMIVGQLKDEGIECYIHIDKIGSLKVDDYAFKFIRNNVGADGIVTTKAGYIKKAKNVGLKVVQRSFVVDNRMLDMVLAGLSKQKPDYLEIMPAITSYLIPEIRKAHDMDIIAGGLVDYPKVFDDALSDGASFVSTSNVEMWKQYFNNDL